jgi:hypothetical protein
VLFILIPFSWLAAVTFVAAMCQAAASGDDAFAGEPQGRS